MIGPCHHIDEFGTEWERKTAHVGALLQLQCPAPIEGKVVSVLIRSGASGDIGYRVTGSGAPGLPWPPDPDWTEYGEKCDCETCEGRLVGASVEELRAEMDAASNVVTSNLDTYLDLRYLESARDLIADIARDLRYGIHRIDRVDTYVRADRRVEVPYDTVFDVEAVRVLTPSDAGSYPATISGAGSALQLAS